MAFVTADQFKANHPAAKAAGTDAVSLALTDAEGDLVKLVGQDAVDDAKSETPTDATRAVLLTTAHDYLSMSVFVMNSTDIKSQQNEGSPALSGRMVTDSKFSMDERLKWSGYWRDKAIGLIAAYVIGDEPGEEGYVPVSASENLVVEFTW